MFTILADAVESSTIFSVKIDIAKDMDAAREIVEVYQGFDFILNELETIDLKTDIRSPSSLLAKLLNAERYQSNIERYSFSTSFLREIIELQSTQEVLKENFDDIFKKRLAYILGYWLHNTILQFPGLILNKTATCSYLNIEQTDFEKNKHFFDTAKYDGPFSIFNDYWWKPKLDLILDDKEVWTGLELLQQEGVAANSCKCYIDENLDAGYYCFINKKPVSKVNSTGQLSWLPDGAVLCRAGNDDYEIVAPLLGLH